jgi:hypothetical protein
MLTYPRASVRKLAQRVLAPPNRSEPKGCVSELLRNLLQCPRPEVPECARVLALHGRAVVPECLEAGRPCGPQTRRRLCQVFWLLGPLARGAEQMLAGWLPEPEAEAALLAMEHFGSPFLLEAMIESTRPRKWRRRDWPEPQPVPIAYPIWLDQQAVDRLCDLALGHPLEILAVRALGGFGPARRRAIPLLSYLARTGSQTAKESLLATGFPEAIDVLLELGELEARLAPDPRFSLESRSEDHLLQALFRIENWSQHLPRLHQLRDHPREAVRLAALRILLRRPDPSWAPALMRHRRAGVRIQAVGGLEAPDLEAALKDSHPLVRQRAAQRLVDSG